MISIKKRIASLLVSCAVAGSMSLTASADTFAFNLGRGESGTFGPAKKYNYLSYATVTVSSGTLSSNNFMYFSLIYNGSLVSGSEKRTGDGTFKIFYSTTTPPYGSDVYLQGNAGYYGASASGTWTP